MILENKMAKCLEILREICFVVIVTCMLTVCKMHLMKR